MAELHRERKGVLRGALRRRGIYLLPNLFTTAGLFFGFYAIVQAMIGHFERAAVAVDIAMVLDGLDGRVARLTRTQSEFGAEYDSLADMVSFGAAPVLIMYVWALQPLGRLGWIAAFVYCVGAALRLARFNTNIDIVDKRFFQGLPSPAAAALVAGFVCYNGNARGLPNRCDSTVPGQCGCIQSEVNALIKAPGSLKDKVVFVSNSPCVMCAKLIINSGVTHVFYRHAYRDPSGVELLQAAGVTPVLYDRWQGAWR